MKPRLLGLIVLAALSAVPALAQRSRRSASKAEDTGPVSVMRSAAMRISIASDTVGIFEYLSTKPKLEQWFPDQAIIEPQLGGKYHFRFNDAEGVWSGVVTEFIRGNTLGYTWMAPNDEYETNVRFKLSPQGPETIVELTHSGFTSSAALDKAVTSWVFFLQNLKSVIEQGTDMRGQQTRQRPTRPRRRPAA
jgi:uncharacterized protein YndB with AHSA1/START domain